MVVFTKRRDIELNAAFEHRILIVEDDPELGAMVSAFLTEFGYQVEIETRGDHAVGKILASNPDAIVLDIGLPGLDGFRVCRAVRQQYEGPIIMLTARGEEIDEVVGIESGADDYMAKPVRPQALLARLRSHLRKVTPTTSEDTAKPIVSGSLKVDPARRMVFLDGEEVVLTSAEFDLILLLAENVGKVLSRQEMYPKLYGLKYDGMDRSLDLRVSRLRKKIGDDPNNPERIKSVRGVGYILARD
jgi:two-component system, OmpR family, response regulator RstA